MAATTAIDRLAMRARPDGTPIMEQVWNQLLFLHWPFEEAQVRPLIPAGLELDTFEGKAWVGITPFRLTGLHLTGLPPVPGLSAFNEVNVRTYVHHEGKPGIWFFSLDASRLLAAVGARVFYGLPYYNADIVFSEAAGELRYHMVRSLHPEVRFDAQWRPGPRLRDPDTESLAFFLAERYALFGQIAGRLQMTRVYHHPWILEEANLLSCESTLLNAAGLPEPTATPLVHFSSEALPVQVWPPELL